MISKNTKEASGELWEIDCAKDEEIPMIGIYVNGATSSDKPDNMYSILCKEWTWDNVSSFIESI